MHIFKPAMRAALNSGMTHLCHAWLIHRSDGRRLGLTDHDTDLFFEKTVFHADSGMSLSALDIGSALDRSQPEAEGVLGSPHLAAADLKAGLYDDARFSLFLVDWQKPDNRLLLMAGAFGVVQMVGHQFRVGLTLQGDALQHVSGRLYQRDCDAVLGDKRCGFALQKPTFLWRTQLIRHDRTSLTLPAHDTPQGWFSYGEVGIGDMPKISIRDDRIRDGRRHISLWQEISGVLAKGTKVSVSAGCDKRFSTCRKKFRNQINFQGFPDLADDKILVNVGG